MKIFGYELRKIKKDVENRSLAEFYNVGGINYSTYGSISSSKALTLSAVYRAVNLISDAVASLQMKVYDVDEDGFKKENSDDELYNILGYEPNPKTSRFDFYKMIVSSLLLTGNAYIRVYRGSEFSVQGLEFIDSYNVTIFEVKNDLRYKIAGETGLINSSDMIHIRNYPQPSNVYGVSTIQYAANTLDISYSSDAHASEFFGGGANAAAILSTAAGISPKQQADLKEKMANTPNGIVPIGGIPDLQLHKLGISPRDSQLLETRNFNVQDIGRFFGVNPILLFDNTKGTYANVENAQLSFLNETLLSYIEKLENEFSRKLIFPSERTSKELRFDLSNLLRADSNSRATYFKSLFEMGVISANQIAKELNLPKIEGEGGSKHYISTNLQDANNPVVTTDNSVDNKLKK